MLADRWPAVAPPPRARAFVQRPPEFKRTRDSIVAILQASADSGNAWRRQTTGMLKTATEQKDLLVSRGMSEQLVDDLAGGDFLVAEPASDEAQHLELASGERGARLRDRACRGRRDHALAHHQVGVDTPEDLPRADALFYASGQQPATQLQRQRFVRIEP